MAVRKSVRLDRRPVQTATPRQALTSQPTASPPVQGANGLTQGCGVVLVIIVLVLMLAKCSSGGTPAPGVSGSNSLSEPAFVAARSLNCRSDPQSDAAVVSGLTQNERVVIAERQGDWARLDRDGTDCWASSNYLGAAPVAAAAGVAAAQGLYSGGSSSVSKSQGRVARSGKAYSKSKRRSRSSRARARSYGASSCPCSGSQICIGPRGGRYCITSGGNKRYGV